MKKPYLITDWDGDTLKSLQEYLVDYYYRTYKEGEAPSFVFYITPEQFESLKSFPVDYIKYSNDTPNDYPSFVGFNGCQITFKLKSTMPKKSGYGKKVK